MRIQVLYALTGIIDIYILLIDSNNIYGRKIDKS